MLRKVQGKLVGVATTSMVVAGTLMAGDSPTIPATPLKADYAIFDYVFAGVLGVAFVMMVAKRTKGFIR